MLMVHPNKITG